MPNAGTLDAQVNVDPTGMIRGFGRSRAEIKKFERELTTSTRSIGRSFTSMATDFAIGGDVSVGAFKRLTQSAVGLASVFGTTGILVSAIVGAGLALWNWHERAREEAEETEKAYRKLASSFSLPTLVEAVQAFEVDPDKGGKLAKWTRELEDAQARLLRIRTETPELFNVIARAESEIAALQKQMAPLEATRKRLVSLVEEQAAAESRSLKATDLVAQREKDRLETMRRIREEQEHIFRLRTVEGPALRAALDAERAVTDRRFGAPEGAMPVVNQAMQAAMERMVPTIAGVDMALFHTIRDIAAFANALTEAAGKAKAAGEAMISSVRSGVGGALAGMGGIGTHLGALVTGGPTGLLGSLAGSVVTKLGKFFGFGRRADRVSDAMERLRRTTDALQESMSNIPQGYFIPRAAAAGPGGPPGPGPVGTEPGDLPPGGGGPSGPPTGVAANVISIEHVTVVANNVNEMRRELEREALRKSMRGGVTGGPLGLARA
jgi:hypothetical protein